MGWNDDSDDKKKNPWGKQGNRPSGGRDDKHDPWKSGASRGGGSGGFGGGEPPPDIDELLKKAQDNLRQVMPGNFGGGKAFFLILLGGLLLWLSSGFYIVNPGEHAVVQRFGAWDRTKVTEGLGYRLPWPAETMQKVNVTEVRRMPIGFIERGGRGMASQKQDIPDESLMLTSDANIVDLDLVVLWRINSAEEYLFNIRDQENTIKKVAESAIREVIGQTRMFPIITQARDEVANRAREIMTRNLDEYKSGVRITQVLIQEAEVHPDVQNAFQDVQSAKQDAFDVQNRAQAYRQDILPKARGQAIKMLQQSQAYKESAIARAKGDADRFNAVYQAYLTGKDVTKKRIYLETMEDILGNAQKIIMDEGGSGVVPYLPLDQLRPSAGNSSQ